MTSREMVQDSATRNQRTLADAVVATNRFRELDARFKSARWNGPRSIDT